MFHGSMVALVTPMHDDGSLDFSSLEKLVEFHVDNGTDAIVSMGTTGESATLDEKEHIEVVRRTVAAAAGRIKVIAGTGANSTSEAVTLTRLAKDAGADACLLVTPYYNKPTQEGLYRHFRAVAEAVDIPQILYNVPGRTAVDMSAETTARLSELDNIIGIKDATGHMQRAEDLKAQCVDGFELYSGDDATTLDFIARGGRGCISVTANVAPGKMHQMCELALAGDRNGAEAINEQLSLLHQRLFLESNPIPVKWAVSRMGLMPGGIRLPLTPLSDEHHDAVLDAMAQAGISG